jgi:hypothetical protein
MHWLITVDAQNPGQRARIVPPLPTETDKIMLVNLKFAASCRSTVLALRGLLIAFFVLKTVFVVRNWITNTYTWIAQNAS